MVPRCNGRGRTFPCGAGTADLLPAPRPRPGRLVFRTFSHTLLLPISSPVLGKRRSSLTCSFSALAALLSAASHRSSFITFSTSSFTTSAAASGVTPSVVALVHNQHVQDVLALCARSAEKSTTDAS